MTQTKIKAVIGLILILLASLAEPTDLNKIVFGFGLAMSYQYLVKEFTMLAIWVTLKTTKRAES